MGSTLKRPERFVSPLGPIDPSETQQLLHFGRSESGERTLHHSHHLQIALWRLVRHPTECIVCPDLEIAVLRQLDAERL